MQVTREIASKVLSVVDQGLVRGLGYRKPGEMCIEAAVCYAYGLPHSDNPPCVGSAVRAFKIKLNDSNWPSKETRAFSMRKLAIAQLGSDSIDQAQFSELLAIKTVQRLLPEILLGKVDQKLIFDCKNSSNLDAAYAAAYASAAYAATHAAAYASAAYAAANAATHAAAYATASDATVYAAASAADAAAYAAYAATRAAARASSIKILILSADICLEVLKELKSPGCEFLYLCEEK